MKKPRLRKPRLGRNPVCLCSVRVLFVSPLNIRFVALLRHVQFFCHYPVLALALAALRPSPPLPVSIARDRSLTVFIVCFLPPSKNVCCFHELWLLFGCFSFYCYLVVGLFDVYLATFLAVALAFFCSLIVLTCYWCCYCSYQVFLFLFLMVLLLWVL